MAHDQDMEGGFCRAEEVAGRAARIFERERRRLASLAPEGELVLTGASSLPGALTSGDIDLHLRVPRDAFATTVEALKSVYAVVKPEIWCETLATFTPRGDETTGIAVTPIDSVHDRRFVGSWRRLRADPDALAAYNALKQSFAGPEEPAYVAAKSAFFDALEAAAQEDELDRKPA